MNQYFQQLNGVLLGVVGVSVILYFVSLGMVPSQLLLSLWLAYMLLLSLVRWFIASQARDHYQVTGFYEAETYSQQGVFVGLTGLGFGAIAWIIYNPDHQFSQILVFFTVSSLAAAAINTLGYLRTYYRIYLLFLYLPMAYVVWSYDSPWGFLLLIAVLVVYLDKTTTAFSQMNALRILRDFEKEDLMKNLVESKVDVEEANRIKSRFLANMSHELRTPLNAIMGYTHLLKQRLIDDRQSQKDIANIETASGELLQILNDILDFSSMDKASFQIHPQPFAAKKTFDSLLQFLSQLANSRNITLEFQLLEPMPDQLIGDAQRLKQMIYNLVTNAIKFSQSGQRVQVTLSYEHRQLKILVEDQGIGMDKDTQARIFEPFSQSDTSETRQYRGNGLGLTLVLHLVKLMDAQVFVDSEKGKGTAIRLEIPLSVVVSLDPAKPSQKVAERLQGHVLVVEDEPTNQQLLKTLLQKWGLEVSLAADGAQGVRQWQAGQFDVILMDENMPVMTGIQATQAIRQEEAQRGLQPVTIIAVTANALAGDEQRFLAAGMDAYLAKPVNFVELKKLVQQVLNGPSA